MRASPRHHRRWLPLLAVLAIAPLLLVRPDGAVEASKAGAPPPTLAECAAMLPADGEEEPTEDELERQDDCYTRAMAGLVRRDARDGLRAVREHAARERSFARRCHMLLHPLGRRYGAGGSIETVPHDGKDCAAGFVHGAMERRLGSAGDLDRTLARAWCSYARTPLRAADCEHGLGHVLMRNSGNDLRASLRRCPSITDTEVAARHCAGGAFMENRFAVEGRDDAGPARVGHTAADMCSDVPAVLLTTCHAWAVRAVPPKARLRHCASLPMDAARRACRVATGAVSRSKRRCGAEADCWYGRGFQADAPHLDPATVCTTPRRLPGRLACARGVGFRRGATAFTGTEGDAVLHCRSLFPGAGRLQAACQAGFQHRLAPIDFM